MENNADTGNASKTHFGFESVAWQDKVKRVGAVFDSVASRYDVMNDLMSAGLHRCWKAETVKAAALRPGMRVLDVAGGTGDMTRAMLPKVSPGGQVWLTDINESMLAQGRDRLLNLGLLPEVVCCNAEQLPFPDGSFDRVVVAFGLRNMTHQDQALAEMTRVLVPGGRLLVLEFSKIDPRLQRAYDWYSFEVLPRMGRLFAQDADSYRYLAESIRMHPDADTLATMMRNIGLNQVSYRRFQAGIVALHTGVRW